MAVTNKKRNNIQSNQTYAVAEQGKPQTQTWNVNGQTVTTSGSGQAQHISSTTNLNVAAAGGNVSPKQNLLNALNGTGGNGNGNSNNKTNPYGGLPGVSGNTEANVGRLQQGYKPSDAVTAAQQAAQEILDQKPGEYNSRYQAQLDEILAKIQNPEEFRYSFNGDNLFKAYADMYTQKAKQASADAMGQAAALTGGYGNSYAQSVGNQMYQQNMLDLYDKGMDLRDRAYQAYLNDQQNIRDQFGILQGLEQTDYNRYRDTYQDWATAEEQAWNRAMETEKFDYGKYNDELNYWTGLAQVENQDYRNEQARQEAIRQWEAEYNEKVRQYNEDAAFRREQWEQNCKTEAQRQAYNVCAAILANGNMPSDAQLAAAGLSREDAEGMRAQTVPEGGYGGGGGGNGGGGGGGNGGGNGGSNVFGGIGAGMSGMNNTPNPGGGMFSWLNGVINDWNNNNSNNNNNNGKNNDKRKK